MLLWLYLFRFREQLPPSRDEKKAATHVETITRAVQSKSRRKRKVRQLVLYDTVNTHHMVARYRWLFASASHHIKVVDTYIE